MLSDTPIPTFPIKREGAHRCPELSPIQAIPHFKDFAPLALFQQLSRRVVESVKVKTAVYTYFGDAVELGEGFLDSPFQVIGLDFASGKRNWELLSRFPDDKELGFGIVDARNTRLETVEALVEAIQRVTSYLSPSRLYVNPSAGLEYLPRKSACQKLRRMVEGVHKAREVVGHV